MTNFDARAEEAFHEYVELLSEGLAPGIDEYCQRFPENMRTELRQLLEALCIVRGSLTGPMRAGQVVGDYHIIEEIGRGGMGVVWRAEQTSLQKPVAIKTFLPGNLISGERRERFRQEAEIGGQLTHPNIVAVYAIDEHEGMPFIVQELVEGGFTVADRIDELRRWPEIPSNTYREIAALMAKVAEALEVAHTVGVVHRDLKPGNILLAHEGEPKVADFGLALVRETPALTRTGRAGGTPFYMSPEQCENHGPPVEPTSDVFSLGVVLYEALTLERPFKGDSVPKIFEKICQEEPVNPQQIRARIPTDLAAICLKALRKRPERRYRSMAALAEDLRRFLRGEATRARPLSVVRRLALWIRRHPFLSSIVALGTVTLTIIVALYFGKLDAEEWTRRWGYSVSIQAAAFNLREENGRELARRLEASPEEFRDWEFDYLSLALDSSLAALPGHDGGVTCLTFSPDGSQIASGDFAGGIRLWDPNRRVSLATLSGHGDWVTFVSYSSDGSKLLSGSMDGGLKIWDTRNGSLVHSLDGHVVAVTDGLFSPDGSRVASASGDCTVRIWNTSSGKSENVLRGHDDVVNMVLFSSDGRYVVSASDDRTVRVWNSRNASPLVVLRDHAGRVRCLALSRDGERIASADDTGQIRIRDASSWQDLNVIEGERGAIRCLEFGPNSRILATGSTGGATQIFDVEAAREIASHKGSHDLDWIEAVDFHPDGTRMASSSFDKSIRILDTVSGTLRATSAGCRSRVNCIEFSPDGKLLISGSSDGLIRIWDAYKTGARVPLAESEEGHFTMRVRFSSGGDRIVAADVSGFVRVWDARSGRILQRMDTDRETTIECLAMSPDDREIAVGTEQGEVLTWELEGEHADIWTVGVGAIETLAYTHDGNSLIAVSSKGRIAVRDMHLGETRIIDTVFDSNIGTVTDAALHPDNQRMLLCLEHSSGKSGALAIVEWRTGRILNMATMSNKSFRTIGCSPGGRQFATGDIDGAIETWSVATLEQLRVLGYHNGAVYDLAYNHTGRRIVSASMDRRVGVWDSQGTDGLLMLSGHEARVIGVDFSPDGERIVSGSRDGAVALWESNLGTARAMWQGLAGR